MQNRYTGYRTRAHRTVRGRRDAHESDAIVVALTAQILVCIVLLLTAGVLKKVDPQEYEAVKTQYNVMTGDEAQWKSEGGILSSIGQVFGSIIDKITGTGAPPPADNALSVDAEQEQRVWAEQFSYDYLSPDTAQAGAGGLFPVNVQENRPLSAPEGTTLAPVYLGGRIIAPVEGVITSDFAYRFHPVSGESDFHTGMDIAAEEGRNILAALPGEVVEVGESEIYGNYIVLQHADNLQTSYAHCSEVIAGEGMWVRQGERIAKVGQTGLVTGPHLHFSVVVDETYTDPAWVLGDNIRVVE